MKGCVLEGGAARRACSSRPLSWALTATCSWEVSSAAVVVLCHVAFIVLGEIMMQVNDIMCSPAARAGFFSSRVWDGARFTDVHDMAHFQGASSSWLPLSGGRLQCKQAGKCTARVSALAWDADSRTLFIGGKFNFLSEAPITSGLCMWSQDTGVVSFSSDAGAGLSLSSPSGAAEGLQLHAVSAPLTLHSTPV